MIWCALQFATALFAAGAGMPGSVPAVAPGHRPDPVSLIVLSLDGRGNASQNTPSLAREIGKRLYSSGLFRPPEGAAVWMDPHYGYLGKCSDKNCAWRATLLLNVRYTVVGSLSGYGDDLTLDMQTVEGESGTTRNVVVHGPYDRLVPFAASELAGSILGFDPYRRVGVDSATQARADRMKVLERRIEWSDRGALPLGIAGSLMIVIGIGKAVDTSKGPAQGWTTTNIAAVAAGAGMVGLATWLYFRGRFASEELQQEQHQLGTNLLSFAPIVQPHTWGARLDAAF